MWGSGGRVCDTEGTPDWGVTALRSNDGTRLAMDACGEQGGGVLSK